MENYEKKYKESLRKATKIHRDDNEEIKHYMEVLFPELKESEDERIRKELISFLQLPHPQFVGERKQEKWIDWLEKQANIDKISYEIAEKEKYDFVSGQFIECRKSFNEFKEGNSYWLEYAGNDNYIGRSDNILNQKFHITPRQLYRLFTQQHCPKEDNAIKETNAPTGYGKYVDECLNEAAKHFLSEGEDKYSIADLFYAGVRCGQSWLEKQGNKPVNIDIESMVSSYKQRLLSQGAIENTPLLNLPLAAYRHGVDNVLEELNLKKLEKQCEQKVSAVEFNAKDWYVSKVDGKIYNAKFMEKPHTNQTRKLEIEKAAMSATGIIEQEEWFIKGAEWADENPSYISSETQGEQKYTKWSEEDDYNLQCMVAKVTSDIQKGIVGRNNELIDWLKSLKNRIK